MEVWTRNGLVTFYVLAVMHLKSRRVHIAGITPSPNTTWMKQACRNLTDCEDGFIGSVDAGSEPHKNGAETKNGAADDDDDNSDSLSDSDPVCITDQKAPRVTLYSNQCLVELSAYEINKLRRPFKVPFYEWTPVSAIPLPQNKPKRPRYDRMKLAHEYQSLLDSGEVKTRAELARHLGVSRARVTQVLKRLSER